MNLLICVCMKTNQFRERLDAKQDFVTDVIVNSSLKGEVWNLFQFTHKLRLQINNSIWKANWGVKVRRGNEKREFVIAQQAAHYNFVNIKTSTKLRCQLLN